MYYDSVVIIVRIVSFIATNVDSSTGLFAQLDKLTYLEDSYFVSLCGRIVSLTQVLFVKSLKQLQKFKEDPEAFASAFEDTSDEAQAIIEVSESRRLAETGAWGPHIFGKL